MGRVGQPALASAFGQREFGQRLQRIEVAFPVIEQAEHAVGVGKDTAFGSRRGIEMDERARDVHHGLVEDQSRDACAANLEGAEFEQWVSHDGSVPESVEGRDVERVLPVLGDQTGLETPDPESGHVEGAVGALPTQAHRHKAPVIIGQERVLMGNAKRTAGKLLSLLDMALHAFSAADAPSYRAAAGSVASVAGCDHAEKRVAVARVDFAQQRDVRMFSQSLLLMGQRAANQCL